MSTQTNIEKLVDSMVAQGVPTTQAVALASSIEHAIMSPSYAAQYGSFLVDALKQFVEQATAGPT